VSTGNRVDKPSWSLRLDKAVLTPGSRVRIEDAAVTPLFRAGIKLEEAQLTDLDSSKPDQPSALRLAGKIGEYGYISLDGRVQPLSERLTLETTGTIKSLDLPPLSPYSNRFLGYNLKSGHLNVDSNLNITAGRLDGKNKLLLNNLEITPADPSRMESLTKQLNMSLDAALSIGCERRACSLRLFPGLAQRSLLLAGQSSPHFQPLCPHDSLRLGSDQRTTG